MRKDSGQGMVYLPSNIRNFCIISHVDHGKTTLSDHLLASGGMLPLGLAGKLRALDYLEVEQNRGITIEDSIASFTIESDQTTYMINLIDTPGHVDFSGRVSDALMLVDNGIIIVDAVEGVMAQTITVIRQAVQENLHLTLFINKIDRLITELQFGLLDLRSRIERIIGEIYSICKEFKHTFNPPSFTGGGVIIGSALHGWGVDCQNVDLINGMQGIIDWYKLNNDYPPEMQLSRVFNRIIIDQLKSPIESHETGAYRWEKLGLPANIIDNTKEDNLLGKPLLVIGKSLRRKNAIASIVRVISGSVEIGEELYSTRLQKHIKIKKIEKYRGKRSIKLDKASKGDIVGMVFSDIIGIGDILTADNIGIPVIGTKYVHEPVIAMMIEPQDYNDYDSLVEELEIIEKLNSNLNFQQSQETGELLISGLGPLHLEIIVDEIKSLGFEIYTTQPKVLSYMIPVETGVFGVEEKIIRYGVNSKKIQEKTTQVYEDDKNNTLAIVENTTEIDIDGAIDAYNQWLKFGYEKEKIRDLKLVIHFPDNIEQLNYEETLVLMNKIFKDIKKKELLARHEPMFRILIRVEERYIGSVVQVINKSMGEIIEIKSEDNKSKIEAKIPINTENIVDSLRRETEGRIFWNIVDTIYEKK